jgi:glycosyltransferase involved in cell wall biosynthesis
VFSGLDLMLWPSEWLKEGAEQLYGLHDDQSVVVPWGANVPDPGPAAQAPALSTDAPVEILFIGRDWFAKGGPLVFDTVKALQDRGVSVRLNVIGCQPPDFHLNEAVNVIGSLDKAVPADLAQFQDSLRRAHFVVMPSFESYGFAFCEASAYGLPSLCLRVGGVPVRDGINGHALPVGSGTGDFADVVCRYLSDPDSYQALRNSTRQEFQDRLNWDSWGQKTSELLHERADRLHR